MKKHPHESIRSHFKPHPEDQELQRIIEEVGQMAQKTRKRSRDRARKMCAAQSALIECRSEEMKAYMERPLGLR